VNVYLDGQQAESRTIAPTQQESLSLDVGNAANVTLAVCSSQSIYCERFTSSTLHLNHNYESQAPEAEYR